MVAVLTGTPHLALPFRFGPGSFVQVEQDSLDDIASCVQCVIMYHPGQRELLPDFGVADLTFNLQPLRVDDLIAAVGVFEPRADVLADSRSDQYDALVARVRVAVSSKGVT